MLIRESTIFCQCSNGVKAPAKSAVEELRCRASGAVHHNSPHIAPSPNTDGQQKQVPEKAMTRLELPLEYIDFCPDDLGAVAGVAKAIYVTSLGGMRPKHCR
jgi:hypothetical protein